MQMLPELFRTYIKTLAGLKLYTGINWFEVGLELQGLAFAICLFIFLFLPQLGHLVKEILAEMMRRRYKHLLQRFPRLPAWKGLEIPAAAKSFWGLQVNSFTSLVFSFQTDFHALLSPLATAHLALLAMNVKAEPKEQ